MTGLPDDAHKLGEDFIAGDDAAARASMRKRTRSACWIAALRSARACARDRGLHRASSKPGGIDQPHGAAADLGLGLAAVARQARLIVDKRKPLAGEPVEKGGLADIRPADDGDGKGHGPVGLSSLASG